MKRISDFKVTAVEHINDKYVLLRLLPLETLLTPLAAATANDGGVVVLPGQFVEVRVDGSPSTFLRRPISVCNIDAERNELWLLVAAIGDGTRQLAQLQRGDSVNIVYPLGRGFNTDGRAARLLIGGGVGVAPLLYHGKTLAAQGCDVTFLLGARTAADLLLLDEFAKYGRVCLTTEDGTSPVGYAAEAGFVTNHSVLAEAAASGQPVAIACCGPKPMMKAVARYAVANNIDCEVSLENKMACGVGACLCCVEKTTKGHRCVCTDGPVFNVEELAWQI